MAIRLNDVLQENTKSVVKYPIAEREGEDQRRIIIIGCADGAIPAQPVFGDILDKYKIDVERNAGALLDEATIGRILFLAEYHPTELILYVTHSEWCGAEKYANSPAGQHSTIARLVRARTPNFLILKAEVQWLYESKLSQRGREPIEVAWVDLRANGLLVPRFV